MTQHLLLIGIGPVHEFIERARRTRDVWFGSWILSELARTVAHSLSTSGCTLIFPAPDTLAAVSNQPHPDHEAGHAAIANQILVHTPGDPGPPLNQARQAFTDRLTAIAQAAWEACMKAADPGATAAAFDADAQARAADQIADVFTFHWATVPLERPASYGRQRQSLYRLFSARKHTRTFGPIPWQQTTTPQRRSNKSSLDGWREQVVPGAKQGENLSGVDLLKRYARPPGDQDSFPSTSHMAALPFSLHLENVARNAEQVRVNWQAYVRRLDDLDPRFTQHERVARRFQHRSLFGRYDGSLIYESRLGEDIRAAGDTAQDRAAWQDLLAAGRGHLADFFAAQSDLPAIPPGYYAILAADGDRMGDLIQRIAEHGATYAAGPRDPIIEHQRLSAVVAAFARQAVRIVEERHQGAVIYAGGDDVLALLPLHTMVACAQELATFFARTLKDQGFADYAPTPPTLSVGIAIVHHLDALQGALQLARDAEKIAKRQRNALAITLSKRNGGATTITGRWDGTFLEDLTWLVEQHQTEALPDGFIFELRDLHQRFDVTQARSAAEAAAWSEIIRLDAARILKRKQTPRGEPVSDAVIARLLAMLQPAEPAATTAQLSALINHNLIARELASMQRMVEGNLPERMRDA